MLKLFTNAIGDIFGVSVYAQEKALLLDAGIQNYSRKKHNHHIKEAREKGKSPLWFSHILKEQSIALDKVARAELFDEGVGYSELVNVEADKEFIENINDMFDYISKIRNVNPAPKLKELSYTLGNYKGNFYSKIAPIFV